VGDSTENLLDLVYANFRIKPIERVRTCKSSVGFSKPGHGPFSAPQHFFGKGSDPA
jgi:hypothetical protein